MIRNFFFILVASSFVYSVVLPSWKSSVEFMVSLLALVAYQFIPKTSNEVTRDEFEQMKTAINTYAKELKQVHNKVTGVRMKFGVKD